MARIIKHYECGRCDFKPKSHHVSKGKVAIHLVEEHGVDKDEFDEHGYHPDMEVADKWINPAR